MIVFLILTLSPLGAIDIISKTFCPSSRLTVVEKLPFAAGSITSSVESVMTITTALLADLPDTTKTLLLTTSSSLGLSTVKKTEGIGVGAGEAKEIVLLLLGVMVFVV